MVAALRSPNNAAQFAARQPLVEYGQAAHSAVEDLFVDGRPHERARALYVLADLPATGQRDVTAALGDRDPRIRECALQILVRDVSLESVVAPQSAAKAIPPAVAVLNDVLPLMNDPDVGVRRALLMGLRNVSTADAGPA